MNQILKLDGTRKQADVNILTLDKKDSKLKLIGTDKEGRFILIKRTVNQEDITISNTCAPNSGTPNFTKIILLNLKTQSNIIH